jgi:hypothetical protein
LDVVDEDVDVGEHGAGGLFGRAVDRIDGEAGGSIFGGGYFGSGEDVATYAVLGREQSDEANAGGLVEDVDGSVEVGVDAGGVGDEAYAFALEEVEIVVAEHFDAGADASLHDEG